MGNCFTSKAEDDQKEEKTTNKAAAVEGRYSSMFQAVKHDERRKEKSVRFRQCEEDVDGGGNLSKTESGVVRIRLVLTQKELDQILNGENRHSSTEKLLKAIYKMRSEGISSLSRPNHRERDAHWTPTLESIPEDH